MDIYNNFNYKIYLENYPDLRHFNEEDAFKHWNNYGIKEGRTCDRIYINIDTNVTIIIHLFHENLFDEFLDYIKNVQAVFKKVNVIFTIQQNSNIAEKIKSIDPLFVTIPVENKGVDIYAFLVAIKYMRQHFVTDFILKLHTKINNNYAENLFEWRKQLIKPITNCANLIILQHYFKKLKNIGYVAAQSCVLPKNFDLQFYQNIIGVNNFCSKFPTLEKEWTDFICGTMFWISNETINQITDEMIDYISQNVSYGKPSSNYDNNIAIEYVCERIFTGILCYDKTNILINDLEYTPTSKSISISDTYFYNPRGFSMYQPKKVIFN